LPAQSTFVFPTVTRKNHQTFGFIKIGHITGKFYGKKNAPQASLLDENIAPQAKLMKKIAPLAIFF